MQDLGLSEERFWSLTPRELTALFHALATKEARWRFFMAASMGAKHKSGRDLKLSDFLPEKTGAVHTQKPWQSQLAMLKDLMKPNGGYEETERGTWVKAE